MRNIFHSSKPLSSERKRIRMHSTCQTFVLALTLALSLADTPLLASESAVESAPDDPFSSPDLCEWQSDYAFFTGNNLEKKTDQLPCDAENLLLTKEEVSTEEKEGESFASADGKQLSFEQELRSMLAGYPIEAMVPYIARYDRDIAGLIVGIAKKESNWGKRVPLDSAGEDCFNYWGYKGAGARGIAMGHGCFANAEEAVQAIGKRLQELVAHGKTSEPKNMTIWKCGSSCATHSPESVRKWVSDVDVYFRAIARK